MLSLNRVAGFYLAISFSFWCLASFGANLHKPRITADTTENHIKECFIRYHKLYPQEKLFVHTDEQTYSSGETIWFKVYSLCYGKPSTLSKIVYLQLTNDSGRVVYQNKAPLVNGKAFGNMELSPAIKSGWYHLSAFTAWMMNFDHRLYFHQNIYILNPNNTTIGTITTQADANYKIDFYPESGDLIANTITTIAFKATSSDGTPLQVHGLIKNNKNKSLIAFKASHNGMGIVNNMDVLPGAAYTASVYGPDGNQREISLPEVKNQGISLNANQSKDSIELKIQYTGPAGQYADCILVASQNYGQIATYPLHLGKGINVYDLAKNLFKTGIVRFTIFNNTSIPEAERIVFVHNHDAQLTLSATDSSHTGQSSSTLKLLLKNNHDKALKANLSVSVIDVSQGDAPASTANIYSGLLLSPELEGPICNAGYYFTNQSDSLQNQLDLVMLTNGWRHFVWEPMLLNQNLVIKHPIETEQFISGQIINYKKLQNPKLAINILIQNQDSSKFIGRIVPDSSGRFILPNFNHSGLSEIYIERLEKGKYTEKLNARLFTTLADSLRTLKADTAIAAYATPALPSAYLSAQKKWALANMQTQGIVLQEVKIKATGIPSVDKLVKEHVGALYQVDRAYTADLVNNPTVNMDLVDYLRGRFPGLQVYGSGTVVQFIYLSTSTLQSSAPGKNSSAANSTGGTPYPTPFFYLNESPVNYDRVMDIPLTDVAIIRFVPPPVSFAPYNGGSVGAILIYTKSHADDERLRNTDNNFNHFTFNGYSITREFKSDNNTPPLTGNAKNNRLLLYWAHDINTNTHGEADISIEPGKAKKFEVIIQGMDDDGNLVYHQQYFER